MKELNEYKSEIFRRSARKKQQIKKRRRIALAVSVPLCLCCVITLTMLPGLMSKCDKVFVSNKEMIFDYSESDAELPSNETVESYLITDPDHVAMVQRMLEEIPREDILHKDELDREDATADRIILPTYRLILRDADDTATVYRIVEGEAYCETTGQTLLLTDPQATILYQFVMQVADTE